MSRRARPCTPFVPAEDEIIRRLWSTHTAAQIAALIDRTALQVSARAKRLGCRKRGGDWYWTAEQDAQLRALYADLPTHEVARQMGLSVRRVNSRAHLLGLRKSEARRKEQVAEAVLRARTHPAAIKNHFRKGQVPHNKGQRRPGWAPGRMAETQFKKGRPAKAARNYVPIGTEKVDQSRGAIVRKVTDEPTLYPAARWRPVHVIVWEAANGPVPKGHIVRFRDGMKTLDSKSITADRLECVTLAENMRRNSYHTRYPEEIRRAIQQRGALVRVINRRTKEQS